MSLPGLSLRQSRMEFQALEPRLLLDGTGPMLIATGLADSEEDPENTPVLHETLHENLGSSGFASFSEADEFFASDDSQDLEFASKSSGATELQPANVPALVQNVLGQFNSGIHSLRNLVNNSLSQAFSSGFQALQNLELPVLPSQYNTLFEIADLLQNFDYPGELEAASVSALINVLESAGFHVLAIEGGYEADGRVIPGTVAGELIRLSYDPTYAGNLSQSAGYTGDSFASNSPSLLEGVADESTLNADAAFQGSLSGRFTLGVDADGFFLLGGSGLQVGISATGTVSGNGVIFGVPGSTLAGNAAADLSVFVLLLDSQHKYRPADLAAVNSDTLVALASGTASVDLAFTVSGISFSYEQDYSMAADFVALTTGSSFAAHLEGSVQIPGLINDATGTTAVLTLSGSYQSATQQWNLSGAIPSATAAGLSLGTVEFNLVASPSGLQGNGNANLEVDFLRNGSAPVSISLTFAVASSSITFSGSATAPHLSLQGIGNETLLQLQNAELQVTLSSSGGSNLAGSLQLNVTAAQFLPAQSSFSATIYDGDDADLLGLTLSYDFAARTMAMQADQMVLEIKSAFRIAASGVALSFDRTRTKSGQLLASVASARLDVVAFQTDVLPEGPSPLGFEIQDLRIFDNGFSLASASGSLGNVSLGGFLTLANPTVTVSGLSVTSGKAPTGTFSFNAASAGLYPSNLIFAEITDSASDADPHALVGTINLANRTVSIAADHLTIGVGEAVRIAASNLSISYNPSAGSNQVLASIPTAQISSPLFSNLGTLQLQNLQLRGNGFSLGALDLQPSSASPVRIGDIIELEGFALQVRNFNFSWGDVTSVSGTIGAIASKVELLPDSSLIQSEVVGFSMFYDLAQGGSLRLLADSITLQIGQALRVEAADVTLTPNAHRILSLTQATMSSPMFPGLSGNMNGLRIFQDGLELDSFSVAYTGTATFGDILAVENPTFQATAFSTRGGTISGTMFLGADAVALFPGSTLLQSRLHGVALTYDFNGGGKLKVSVDRMELEVGQALTLVAESVVLSPNETLLLSLPSVSAELNLGGFSATASLSNLEIYADGIKLASGLVAIGPIDLGPLSLDGVTLSLSDLDTTASGVSGLLTATATSASLNLGSALEVNVSGFAATVDLSSGDAFTLSLDAIEVSLAGGAVHLQAQDVTIVPNATGATPIADIATATLTITLAGKTATATVNVLRVYEDGITLQDGTAVLSDSGSNTLTLGPLSVSDLTVTVADLDTRGSTLQGLITVSASTVDLDLGSALTVAVSGFSAVIDLASASDFTIKVASLEVTVAGGVLVLTASDVTLMPNATGATPIADIATATLTITLAGKTATATVNVLRVYEDGITLQDGTAVLSDSGSNTLTLGPLSVSDLTVTVADLDTRGSTLQGLITVSASTVDLDLGSALTVAVSGFSAVIDLASASDFTIKVATFDLNLLDGVLILAATDLVLTPNATGNNPIATAGSITASSTALPGFSGTLLDVALYGDGITIGSGTLTIAAGVSSLFGGAVVIDTPALFVDSFSYRDGVVAGQIGVSIANLQILPGNSVFTTSFESITGEFDFDNNGALRIRVTQFYLRVGELIELTASQIFIDTGATGDSPFLTIASVTATSPLLAGLTGNITGLALYHDGISIATGSLTLPGPDSINIGGFLVIGNPTLGISGFSYRDGVTTGTASISASSIALFPNGGVITSTVTGFTLSFDFNDAGRFVIEIATFELAISTFMKLSASGVQITPGGAADNPNRIARFLSASVTFPQFSGFPGGSVSNLEIYKDGFSIGALSLGPINADVAGIFSVSNLTLTVTNFAVNYSTGVSFSGSITVSADSAVVFPGNSAFTAGVSAHGGSPGFVGEFRFVSGSFAGLRLTAAKFNLSVFNGALTIEALGMVFDPDGDENGVIASVASVTANLTPFGVSATATNLRVMKDGDFRVQTITIDVSNVNKALGLGNFLPFNIETIQFNFFTPDNSLTAFDLTVRGKFDFTKFGSLPFTPIVRIGQPGNQTSISDGASFFDFTVRIDGGSIKVWDLGPIELGVENFNIGQTFRLGGSIRLGGYQNGQWVSSFGGTLSVEVTGAMNNISGGLSVSIDGTFNGDTGILDVLATFTISFKFYEFITVQNASIGLDMRISTAGGGFSVDRLNVLSASVQLIRVQLGSFLVLQATGVTLDFTATGSQNLATFGSITASLPTVGIGGTAYNFAIGADGSLKDLPGFGVSLTVSSSGAVGWPSWLPIQITELGIIWNKGFSVDKTDISIILSAAVTGLNGLPVQVEGVVQGMVIDIGRLTQGLFPITEIGAFGISISGEMFGGEVSGSIILGIIRVAEVPDPENPGQTMRVEIPTGNPGNLTVVDYVFYGAVEGGIIIPGLGGLKIRFGVSSLGPLEIFVYADIPILIEPNTGLTIAGFNAGVRFNYSLPSITDPLQLADPVFDSPTEMTLAAWQVQLRQQVLNQIKAGDSSWNIFASPMVIEGGASLYSMYISKLTFIASVRIALSTDGKMLIQATATFFQYLTLDMRLYMDFSQLGSGSFKIFFLAQFPKIFPLLTIRGSFEIDFGFGYTPDPASMRLDLDPDDPNYGQAETVAAGFKMRITGGVDIGAMNIGITIEGWAEFFFEVMDGGNVRMGLDVQGAYKVKFFIGEINLVQASGFLRFERDGVTDNYILYGIFAVEPNLDFLNDLGIFIDGTIVMKVNTATTAKNITLTFPDNSTQAYVLPALSFSYLIEGYLIFKLDGVTWFRMQGNFFFEIFADPDAGEGGIRAYLNARLLIGPEGNEWIKFNALGFLQLTNKGIAGQIRLAFATGDDFNETLKIKIDGMFTLQLNTTGQLIEFEVPTMTPEVFNEIDRGEDTGVDPFSGFVSISASIPGALPSEVGQPYLLISVTSTDGVSPAVANLFDVLVLEGSFLLAVTPTQLKMEVSASFIFKVGSVVLMEFSVSGGLLISGGFGSTPMGAAGFLSLVRNLSIPVPSGLGFEFQAQFRIEFNTFSTAVVFNVPDNMATPVTATTTLQPGPYVRIFIKGKLTILGFELEGYFQVYLTTTELTVVASATLRLKIGSVSLLTFNATGALRINAQGIAAQFSLSLQLGIPESFGFSLGAGLTATLRINTTGSIQSFDTTGDGNNDLTISNVAFPGGTPGAYAVVHISGFMTVGGFRLTGDFYFEISVDGVAIAASVTFDMVIGGKKLFGFTATAAMRVGPAGLVAYIELSLGANLALDNYNFAFNASTTFILEINTTGSTATLPLVVNPIAPGVRVVVEAVLVLGFLGSGSDLSTGFEVTAKFTFTAQGNIILITVDGTLRIKILGVTIVGFTVTGVMAILPEGFVAGLSVSLSINLPFPFLSFSGSITATLEVNFTNKALVLGPFNFEQGIYARLRLNATLALGNELWVTGEFLMQVGIINGQAGVVIAANLQLYIRFLNESSPIVTVTGVIGIYANGIAFGLFINIPQISLAGFVRITGTFALELNTTGSNKTYDIGGTQYTVQGSPGGIFFRFKVVNVSVTFLHFGDTPTLTAYAQEISVSFWLNPADIGFLVVAAGLRIQLTTSSVPIISSFGLKAWIEISGYILFKGFSDLRFAIKGSLGIDFRPAFVRLTASIEVGIYLRDINDSLRPTSLGFSAMGTALSLKVSGQAGLNILGQFLGITVLGYFDTNGNITIEGTASLSFSIGIAGLSVSLSVRISTQSPNLQVSLSGSAWIGFSFAKIKVSVSATITFPQFSMSLTFSGKILFIKWSFTLKINFGGGTTTSAPTPPTNAFDPVPTPPPPEVEPEPPLEEEVTEEVDEEALKDFGFNLAGLKITSTDESRTGSVATLVPVTEGASSATYNFALTSNPGSLFSLTSGGALSVASMLDYEVATSHTLGVRVEHAGKITELTNIWNSSTIVDGKRIAVIDDGMEWDLSDYANLNALLETARISGNVTVNVNNRAPNINTGQTFAVTENSSNGTVVGTVSLNTSGDLNSVTWSIPGGLPFAINSSTGQITVNGSIDREQNASFNINVTATAGSQSDTKSITINVNNVAPNNIVFRHPTNSGVLTEPMIRNDMAKGTYAGTYGSTHNIANLFATEPGAGESSVGMTFQLWNGSSWVSETTLFAMVGNSLRVRTGVTLAASTTYSLTIRVVDSGGAVHSESIEVRTVA